MLTELWLSQSNAQHIHDLYLLLSSNNISRYKKQENPSLTGDPFYYFFHFSVTKPQKDPKKKDL